jgi:drug/metabolite transporter (DMT)-like permease
MDIKKLGEEVSKNAVLAAGASLVSAGVGLIGSNPTVGVVLVVCGVVCFVIYTRLVEKQVTEKATAEAFQALKEFLKAVREEFQKEGKRNPLSA